MGKDTSPPVGRWLSPERAAELCEFSVKTIYRAIWSGELPASKRRRRWRIRESALRDWIDGERAIDTEATTRMRGRPPAKKGTLGFVLDEIQGDAA